ncbi:hypothetical protein ASZ90_004062 [hydrocarbon metagenome]|uniref:ATP-grasp domain-containing protein n=1 Tax=hydrocarbon metagenome TaxID=938273 RepID=A0A0W8FYY6_9ZZZZ
MKFDLAISYTWIYDIEFTQLIEKMFQANGLSTFVINRTNIDEITKYVREKKIIFTAYLDRASDEDSNFSELGELLTKSSCKIINEYENVAQSTDKSIVQSKLIDAGLKIPKTIIIPPFDKQPELNIPPKKLEQLGKPFVIKPAYYSGGSDGVIKNGLTLNDVQSARMKNKDDNYLIQEKIYPDIINNHRAWFRVLWVFGKVIPLLWDDDTLIYSELDVQEEHPEIYNEIIEQMKIIYGVAKLEYFSSEFALTKNGELFLIDYVNDQCDMRLKSKHPDGVPNKIVKEFISEMIQFVKSLQK